MVCPRCGNPAQVQADNVKYADLKPYYRPRRLTCHGCGLNKDQPEFFYQSGLDLWLSLDCCGETLWAYNYPHLAEIKSYVEANLRERGPRYDTDPYFEFGTMVSWLPKWMKVRKNRTAILKAIDRLAAK